MNTGVPDVSGFSPQAQGQLRRGNLTGALDTMMDGPTPCDCDNPEAVRGLNWEQFVSRSRRQGTTYNGPYGRVEFYNGSINSLPGGSGISDVGRATHLDTSILDIIPIIASAHQQVGLPTRVSHTTGGHHSSNSLHYAGRAIDLDPDPSSRRLEVANKIKDLLASSGRGCGYYILVHTSHIHVSFKGVGRTGCPGFDRE